MSMRIRDAIHGDIFFTDLEEYCIRTPVFQRLHRIKQLGNVYHVYPSATHTRFEHSLGVCHQVKKLLTHIKASETTLSDDEKNLLELAGLLHDIIHTPYKHTLERDSGIFREPPLENQYRKRFDQMKLQSKLKNGDIEFLIRVLAIKDPYQLDKPYQAQLIQDTLCADLLDYARRDTYFTGIRRDYDERIYNHIAIVSFKEKPCLVVKITDERGVPTESAITELINLLEIRYVLNERVYFYPPKIAADSLLVKAFRLLLTHQDINPDVFDGMSDENLLNYLLTSEYEDVKSLAERLMNRVLPALAYQVKRDVPEALFSKMVTYFRGHDSLQKSLENEKKIAQLAGTDPNDIIIYCHDPEMQKKKAKLEILIIDETGIPQFADVHWRRDEFEMLSKKHQNLWRCYVFSLNRDEETLKKVKKAAEEVLHNL